MNQEAINKDLAERSAEESLFQKAVLESARKWMKASANKMQEFHTGWDSNSYIYRGYRVADRDDKDAVKDNEPPKLIVPITYAQVQTALSFIISTYMQRDNIFEVRGTGPEDEKNTMAINTDLAYQLNDQKFVLKLYFWLLDALKQGFGVVQVNWEERKSSMRVGKKVPDVSFKNVFGAVFGKDIPMKTEESVEEVLSYQGSAIRNISPYAFYPDPAVTIANFQEGQFVGHEEETALMSLKAKECDIFFGTDKIPESIGKDLFEERPRRVAGPFSMDQDPGKQLLEKTQGSRAAIKLDLQVTLSEADASKLWKANLGKGNKPVKWLITIANDQKVIRFENCGQLSGRYSYELFEFSPDHDSFFNPGLANTISELQKIVTFFLNSHIVNVRKIIANRFIVDPAKVEMDDIKTGSIFIRTRGAQGDVSRAIKQLETSDITRSHLNDMDALMTLVQTVTGINENALGQYASGRRSATEARSVNAGSAARLKMHATLMWMQGIDPLGRQILSNTRQWRSPDVYAKIVGKLVDEAPFEQVIYADPQKLAGGYDFVPYDATLPTDRQYQAGVLQELFTVLIQNPNTIQLLNKDPMKLLNYIAQLYNIRNIKDFDLNPLGAPMLPPQPQPQVVTDQQAADVAGEGAQPVDMQGEDVLKGLL